MGIPIILCMHKVSPGPLLSSDTFYSIQWFWQQTVKALIRLCICTLIWAFAVQAWRHIFAWLNSVYYSFLTDGRLCWIVKGAHLEVLDISTQNRLAAWHFGKVLKDEHTSVTCVKEFEQGKSCKLLVGVCNAAPTGMLCLFDVAASKVIKAIEIPQQVTNNPRPARASWSGPPFFLD